ncbi:MAG: YhjD/YihY/BrkB family envelope integrity protein [Verrucomicrobiota bacterium]
MAKKVSRFQKLREDALALLDERTLGSLAEFSNWQRFAHFWVLVWRSFDRNRCPVRASALAYATVLALIPMLAVAVSISSALLKQEGEDQIDQFIVKLVASLTSATMVDTNAAGTTTNLTGEGSSVTDVTNSATAATNPAMAATNDLALATASSAGVTNGLPSFARDAEAVKARRAIARYIHEFIQNTRSGALGLTGSILLVFAAISMLSRIEDTFNDIWGVARGRSWFMRIVLYWGVISLAPMLLVVALGLASGPHLEGPRKLLTTMPFVGHVIFQFLPVVVLCLTFALFYALIPNTKVHWQAALAGGLAGGILFHLNNVVSLLYVSRVVSNSKIYGSLGLVPVFMIGLYFSWLILLFGAQVAYAYQNRATYFEEKQVENINQRGREFVALRLMTCVGQRFVLGEPPPSAVEISAALAVPTRLVQQLMQTLSAARLVAEAAGAEAAYLPARPLETITCHDILLALRASQGQELATRDEPARAEVYGEFHRIEEAERQAASSVTMLALVNRAQARPSLTE